MGPDPGGPKTYGSYESGSASLLKILAGDETEEVVVEEEDGVVAEQARILRQIQERNAAEAASLLLIQQLTMQAGCSPLPPPPAPAVVCIRSFYILGAILVSF
jgi:hypothetical protein